MSNAGLIWQVWSLVPAVQISGTTSLETTLHRYFWLYNQHLPKSALGNQAPLRAIEDWRKLKTQLFRKQPCYLPGGDIKTCPDALLRLPGKSIIAVNSGYF